MNNIKERMEGFLKNYTYYIRYLENKVRKLESEKGTKDLVV